MALFVLSGPAEVLRSTQKDNSICDSLDQQISDMLLKIAGTNNWLRYRHLTQICARLLYYGFTTLLGYQTLGEEYTGIMEFDSTLQQIPSIFKRIVMIFLEAAGLTAIHHYLNYVQKNIKNDAEISVKLKSKIINSIVMLKSILPFIQHFHHALFYWNGKYYNITKRLLNINYIRTKPWLRAKRGMYGFKILSIISMLHLIIFTGYSIIKWSNKVSGGPVKSKESNAIISNEKNKCPLCLDTRTATSTTPCGHLFCWNCILEWLQTNDKCPICREHVASSRVVPLLNY